MKRYRGSKHHLVCRSRGGGSEETNILKWTPQKHNAYHLLFGNRTFLEAATLIDWSISKNTIDYDGYWKTLFGDNRTLKEASTYLRKKWREVKG